MFNFLNTRYNRQEQMPEWGAGRQELLREASVVVIGAGGVKATLLLSLIAAGIGRVRIIDFDKVEISNLNRQILYRTSDLGNFKAEAAGRTLRDLNPEIDIEVIREKVDEVNISELCAEFSFVVEGGDSPAGRNLVNEYCLSTGKPFTHASAQFSYGYVFTVVPTWRTACFACFFPDDYERTLHTGAVPVNILSTSLAGTLGAAEVLKWFMGHHESLNVNRRLRFSSLLLSSEFSYEGRPRREDCPVCSRFYF